MGPLGAGRQKRDQRGDAEPRAGLRPLPGIRTQPAGPKPQHGRIENHRTDPALDFGHLLRPHRRPDRVGSRAGRLLADDRRFELRNRAGKRPDTAFPVEEGRRHHHRPGRRFGTRGRPSCRERLPGRAVRPLPRENRCRLRGDRQRGGQPCAGPPSHGPGIPQNRHHHDLSPPPDDGTAAQGLSPRAGGSGGVRLHEAVGRARLLPPRAQHPGRRPPIPVSTERLPTPATGSMSAIRSTASSARFPTPTPFSSPRISSPPRPCAISTTGASASATAVRGLPACTKTRFSVWPRPG